MHSTQRQTPSVLRQLRALTPHRNCGFEEALSVAENQANLLVDIIRALDTQSELIQISHVAQLPRIKVVYAGNMPVSGMSHWSGREWIITIASRDSLASQRFTVLHELKHIIDHGSASALYIGTDEQTGDEQAEMAADYFAGCTLVSERELMRVWDTGIHETFALAEHFSVTESAIEARLAQTGLQAPRDTAPGPVENIDDDSAPLSLTSQTANGEPV